MVCMDKKNSLANTKFVLEKNITNLSIENLWIGALKNEHLDEDIKYTNTFELFSFLYRSLLRELMVESIQTPTQLYTWLINFAQKYKNKKMLWLFTLLKYTNDSSSFNDILDRTNCLEVFALALQTFIKYDNRPVQLTVQILKEPYSLYKTLLLSLVGASYGKVET
jgi:hypothetical protein